MTQSEKTESTAGLKGPHKGRWSDWVGAWVLEAGERRGPPIPGGMTFHIFRASASADLFVIADRKSPEHMPECPGGGEWRLFKVTPETGQRRVGFVEDDAKADIRKRGYHLVRIDDGQDKIDRPHKSVAARVRRRVKRA
jgi:hypothetical protein